MNNIIIENVAWIANILYFVGILPQIWLNFKLKSADGMSDLMLIGYIAGYSSSFFYVFLLGLPLAYKIAVPLSFVAASFLIFQRFYYSKHTLQTSLLFGYLGVSTIIMLFIPISYFYPKIVGNLCGWVCMFVWTIYQIPQILKIWLTGSVYGFSFGLPTIIVIGNFVELFVAIIGGLPFQTIMIDLRGIIVYTIFSFQFWYFLGD